VKASIEQKMRLADTLYGGETAFTGVKHSVGVEGDSLV
jgi:hypothetical protein